MSETDKLQPVVERVVAEVLKDHLATLQQQITKRVLEEVVPRLVPEPGGAPSDLLNAAMTSIQDSTAQTDILKALLEGSAKFAGRVALFVVRAGNASGWQARGFSDNNDIKSVVLDASKGLAGRAVEDQVPVAAAADEFDGGFVERFGAPVEGNALVLPLVIKEKVAALVYADAGTSAEGKLDHSAVELLVRSAALWVEALALRKAAGIGGAAAAETPVEAPPPEEPAPPPSVTQAMPAPIPEPPAAAAPEPEPEPPAPAPPLQEAAAAAPAPAPEAAPAAAAEAPAEAPAIAISPEEEALHKKAKRRAKVLVEELQLYNKDKVAQGRQNKDLYERLKEDIDKSRAAYDKSFEGHGSVIAANYFNKELVRVLAQNDPSLLGANFPR